MSNVHRLTALPKVRRHGTVRCEIDASIPIRELHAALAFSGLILTHNTILRIERKRETPRG